MNDPQAPRAERDEEAKRGPNLWLIYGLIFLAMLVATVVAAYIVLPFYHRH
jgi:hypothetical protein